MTKWSDAEQAVLRDGVEQAKEKRYAFANAAELAQWLVDNTSLERNADAVRKKIQREGLWSPDSANIDALRAHAANVEKENVKLRETGRLVMETTERCIAIAPPVVFPSPKEISGEFDEHYMFQFIGDSQIGSAIGYRDTSGLEVYNYDIFLERAKRLHDKLLLFYNIYGNTYTINNLYVAMLGDIVEGELIYRGQQMYVDQPVIQQVINGAKVFAYMLRSWAKVYPALNVFCVVGNHGRMGKDYHAMNNMDYIVYYIMRLILQDQSNINIFISDSYDMLFDVGRWRWCVFHGDNVKSYLNFPYYGIDRATKEYAAMHHKPIDYFALGHHHRDAELPSEAAGKKYVNGSWVGGSLLSTKILRSAMVPSQTLLLMNDDHGVVSKSSLYLTDRVESEPDDDGIYTPHDELMEDDTCVSDLFNIK